jgi:hypothetical protein
MFKVINVIVTLFSKTIYGKKRTLLYAFLAFFGLVQCIGLVRALCKLALRKLVFSITSEINDVLQSIL